MADLDPVQALLSLGLLSQDVVDAAAKVSPTIASTRAGRLIAAGADQETLLTQLAQLSGIPLATPEMLERIHNVDLTPATIASLRGLMACPVHTDESGTVHVIIADPEAKAGVASVLHASGVYLAAEVDVRILFAKLEEHLRDPVLRQVGKRVERPWEPPSDARQLAPPRPAPSPRPAQATVPPPLKRSEITGVHVTGQHMSPLRRQLFVGIAIGAASTLVVCLAAAVVLWPRADEPIADERGARQSALVTEARQRAQRGEHAWAATKCAEAIEMDASSSLAAEALVICGKAKLQLADPSARDDLKRALQMLSPGTALHAEAEAALKSRP